MVVPEMLGIFGFQERALMMVKPPCKLRRGGVLEIDDGIFVAIKYPALERV
jgi:hypothetical protein